MKMSEVQDYMHILDLRDGFSLTDLKSAYRRTAMKYHPDTISGKGLDESFVHYADAMFRKASEAYDFLKKYLEENGEQEQIESPIDFWDIEDIEIELSKVILNLGDERQPISLKLDRAELFLEDEEWDRAYENIDKALDDTPRNPE
ncbi:MAG: DnaJ domain-containing protein, partial [Spirochaetales bacterium]|nr:DnaJ domain-containing protein [Candidatus Physcosoma equi]